jgi:hypothetical protein
MDERKPPALVEELYRQATALSTDINEHLPLLRTLAAECEHVTEFGVRGCVGSTLAFLAAQPKKLVSWDIDPLAIINTVTPLLFNALIPDPENRTRWEPRVGSTLEIVTEPTDLLFIDTLHTARQLKAELVRHADPIERKVRKYLVFHDTVTFGHRGEDGTEPGLRAVIRWFQKCHAFPLWELIHDRENNNGLIVLRFAY